MTITIDVPAEIAERLSAEAAQEGKAVPEVVQGLVTEHYVNRRPSGRPIRPYDPAALMTLLDSFNDGDPEEQQTTLEYLKVAIDRDRPGQRSIFGEGINPVPPDEQYPALNRRANRPEPRSGLKPRMHFLQIRSPEGGFVCIA